MICDRLIHIHVPRTGGTMFRTLLDNMPGLSVLDSTAHLPYWIMAAHFTDKVPPAVTFVRKPWDWYVSQWCWVTSIGQREFEGDFPAFMDRVQHNFEYDVIHPNFRCLSFWWTHLQAGRARHIGRFENLHDDIVSILASTCRGLVNRKWIREQLANIGIWRQGITPTGVPHGPYQEYYTSRTKSWVAEWDAEIIERFGYEF